MIMLDQRLFQQEWFIELSVDARYMFLYLLSICSQKTGIFELNMRMINFGANTNKKFTKEDLLTLYGNRIQIVPGHENTAIFPAYIRTNWAKGNKPIDFNRSPLFKSIIAELARYDLTMEMVNEMTDKKVEVVNDGSDRGDSLLAGDGGDYGDSHMDSGSDMSSADKQKVEQGSEVTRLFEAFWKEYPGPRKIDKRKCQAKFERILLSAKSPKEMATQIMSGLARWKQSADWQKNNGQFICAPLVWLNNERWEAEVRKGGFPNGNSTANNSYQTAEEDIF